MTGAKAEAGRASAPSTRIAPATTEPDTATSGWRSGCIERGSLGLGVGTCWSSNSSSMTDGSARSAGVCEASDGACARQIAAAAAIINRMHHRVHVGSHPCWVEPETTPQIILFLFTPNNY